MIGIKINSKVKNNKKIFEDKKKIDDKKKIIKFNIICFLEINKLYKNIKIKKVKNKNIFE